MTYRYTTTTGEGTFSATRRYLDTKDDGPFSPIVETIRKNISWLQFPQITEGRVEFYFTEEGRTLYESTLKTLQERLLGQVIEKQVAYDELTGTVVYEDSHQIGVWVGREAQSDAGPYAEPGRYCF